MSSKLSHIKIVAKSHDSLIVKSSEIMWSSSDFFIHKSLLVSTSTLDKEYLLTWQITQHREDITSYYVMGWDALI